jgi:ABC-2 type transport system ATP-binding protein
MLTGLARPDAGSLHTGEIDCTKKSRAAQHLIGVVPDESNLYPELSGFDNLCFCAALYGKGKTERRARAKESLETFDLTYGADMLHGTIHGGNTMPFPIDLAILVVPLSGADSIPG